MIKVHVKKKLRGRHGNFVLGADFESSARHLVLFERDHSTTEIGQLDVFYFVSHKRIDYTTISHTVKAQRGNHFALRTETVRASADAARRFQSRRNG